MSESAVFQETHSGWTYRQTVTGEYEIIDGSGWALATIHYDYRFTCNATNRHRAELLASAPETAAALLAAEERGRVAEREGVADAAEAVADFYDASAITCADMDKVTEHRAAERAIKQFASSIRARTKDAPVV